MSLNLNIPITQTLTLPDNWQACKTPQELSYWIVAKFENFTSSLTDINNALSQLNSMIETNTDNIATNDAEIVEIKTSIANINTTLGEINTSIETLNDDYGLLHSNYMAISNRLAAVEDVAGDIPTIKTDITELQTTTSENATSINTINNYLTLLKKTDVETAFYREYNFYNDYDDMALNQYKLPLSINRCYSTIFIKVSNVDSRLKIVADNLPANMSPVIGFTCNIYYYSDNNVSFGTINNTPADTDISERLKTYSIDGNTALAELMAKTNVAIKIFKVDNGDRPYAWTLL